MEKKTSFLNILWPRLLDIIANTETKVKPGTRCSCRKIKTFSIHTRVVLKMRRQMAFFSEKKTNITCTTKSSSNVHLIMHWYQILFEIILVKWKQTSLKKLISDGMSKTEKRFNQYTLEKRNSWEKAHTSREKMF